MEVETSPTIEKLLNQVDKYATDPELDLIERAYEFADEAHEGQTRMTGKKFIKHPLAVAQILADMKMEPTMIAAALMHDVIEDTQFDFEDIEQEFNQEIAKLVEGDTKIGELKYKGVERFVENWRRLFVAMAGDVRTMIIKLADRVHNIQTIENHPKKKLYKRALESLEIYAPIAGRLGINQFKKEIENKAFPHVYPEKYEQTKELVENKLDEELGYFTHMKEEMRKELLRKTIELSSVEIYEKSLYEIYKESQKQGRELKLYDFLALKVIVSSKAKCYDSLGIIHSSYTPLRERIKDYISQPKANGYQALHTTVFAEENKMVEFHIYSDKMEQIAKYGVATYWSEGVDIEKTQANLEWAQDIAREGIDIEGLEGLEQVKVDHLKTRIFVFTPQGEVINLPEGATPVDFAYEISSKLGNSCKKAIINTKKTSLDTKLKNGDVVKIITDEDQTLPDKDWLDFVKTYKAKQEIESAQQENNGWSGPGLFG
ncbi:MAG: bifunctional (p)ppGpp synthetase/guanosine-3',5'-bis(diphosphate) 3'-pyrophosphohydrolase [Candidatus Paceibacteria bacterium]